MLDSKLLAKFHEPISSGFLDILLTRKCDLWMNRLMDGQAKSNMPFQLIQSLGHRNETLIRSPIKRSPQDCFFKGDWIYL